MGAERVWGAREVAVGPFRRVLRREGMGATGQEAAAFSAELGEGVERFCRGLRGGPGAPVGFCGALWRPGEGGVRPGTLQGLLGPSGVLEVGAPAVEGDPQGFLRRPRRRSARRRAWAR